MALVTFKCPCCGGELTSTPTGYICGFCGSAVKEVPDESKYYYISSFNILKRDIASFEEKYSDFSVDLNRTLAGLIIPTEKEYEECPVYIKLKYDLFNEELKGMYPYYPAEEDSGARRDFVFKNSSLIEKAELISTVQSYIYIREARNPYLEDISLAFQERDFDIRNCREKAAFLLKEIDELEESYDENLKTCNKTIKEYTRHLKENSKVSTEKRNDITDDVYKMTKVALEEEKARLAELTKAVELLRSAKPDFISRINDVVRRIPEVKKRKESSRDSNKKIRRTYDSYLTIYEIRAADKLAATNLFDSFLNASSVNKFKMVTGIGAIDMLDMATTLPSVKDRSIYKDELIKLLDSPMMCNWEKYPDKIAGFDVPRLRISDLKKGWPESTGKKIQDFAWSMQICISEKKRFVTPEDWHNLEIFANGILIGCAIQECSWGLGGQIMRGWFSSRQRKSQYSDLFRDINVITQRMYEIRDKILKDMLDAIDDGIDASDYIVYGEDTFLSFNSRPFENAH